MHKAFKVGFGYDVHRFQTEVQSGAFISLCGVKVPHEHEVVAHSDGDVAIHALVDALLGAACIEGACDIGQVFPPSDKKWENCDSAYFLLHVLSMIKDHGFYVGNVDITIVCQNPKISPHRQEMRAKLCEIMKLDTSQVNVKATTTEWLGFEGRSEGISAYAVVSLISVQDKI